MLIRPHLPAAALAVVLLSGTAHAQSAQQKNDQPTTMDKIKTAVDKMTGSPFATLDPDMRHVLDAYAALGPKPLPDLSASEARKQPSAADAAMQVLREQGKATTPDPAVMTKTILVDGAAGKIVATVFKPTGVTGALPVVVYFHGGGFVIANNSTYAASSQLLAKALNAAIVSVEYSKAPEHKFPASHEDAVAAYKWVTQNAGSFGGDPGKIAIVGESAGGNLAINTAIAARDGNLPKPVHVVAIYPMAGTNLDTPSYKENANAKPLDKPMMEWFYANLTRTPADMQDPRLDIVGKADLKGLPPTTVITDGIDPLRSDGQGLAEKLKAAGVTVDAHNYDGVTHEFFGMGKVVGKAQQAEDVVVSNLKKALAGS